MTRPRRVCTFQDSPLAWLYGMLFVVPLYEAITAFVQKWREARDQARRDAHILCYPRCNCPKRWHMEPDPRGIEECLAPGRHDTTP
jgi:hypothetical protein